MPSFALFEVQQRGQSLQKRSLAINQSQYNLCRCKGLKDEDDAECKFYQKAYRALCPGEIRDCHFRGSKFHASQDSRTSFFQGMQCLLALAKLFSLKFHCLLQESGLKSGMSKERMAHGLASISGN